MHYGSSQPTSTLLWPLPQASYLMQASVRPMALRVLAFFSLVFQANAFAGHETCPCIDPWAGEIDLNRHAPANIEAGCNVTREGGTECYPASYGSSACAAHDMTSTPECMTADESSRPAWCVDEWCWVDLQNCASPDGSTSYFPGVRIASTLQSCPELWSPYFDSGSTDSTGEHDPDDQNTSLRVPLYYSYRTCGSLPRYDDEDKQAKVLRAFAARLPGGKLRVAFPDDAGSWYTLVGNRPYPAGSGKDGERPVPIGGGVGGTNRSGSVPVLFDHMFRNHRIPWEEVQSYLHHAQTLLANAHPVCTPPYTGAHCSAILPVLPFLLVHCMRSYRGHRLRRYVLGGLLADIGALANEHVLPRIRSRPDLHRHERLVIDRQQHVLANAHTPF